MVPERSVAEISRLLTDRRIQLTAQRIAIAEYVLNSSKHPSAEDTYRAVRAKLPVVSKATVYNTLNLLVREGLLDTIILREGAVRYDPLLTPHSHFLDTRTDQLIDIPAGQVRSVQHRLDPARFQVDEIQVVFRGALKDGAAGRPDHEPA